MALLDDLRRLFFPVRAHAHRKAARQLLALARKKELSSSPPLLEELAELLQSPDWEAANDAIKVVGLLKAQELAGQVAEMAGDQRQVGFVRRNSLEALAGMPTITDAILAAFQRGLNDPYWEARMVAIPALARWAERLPGLEAELRQRLTRRGGVLSGFSYAENAFDVRVALMQALGGFAGDLATLDALLAATDDPMWKVRAAALEAAVSVATRGGHRLPKVDAAIANFDQTCLDLRPRFPLSVSYNAAVAQWNRGAELAQSPTVSP